MGDPVRAPARRRMYLPREVTAVLTIGSLGNRCDAALGASDERRTRLFRSGSIIPMKRRELIVGVGAVAILWPRATRAEQTTMPVIGFLSPAHPRILRINYLAFGKASPKWVTPKARTWRSSSAGRAAITSGCLLSPQIWPPSRCASSRPSAANPRLWRQRQQPRPSRSSLPQAIPYRPALSRATTGRGEHHGHRCHVDGAGSQADRHAA